MACFEAMDPMLKLGVCPFYSLIIHAIYSFVPVSRVCVPNAWIFQFSKRKTEHIDLNSILHIDPLSLSA